MLTLHDTLFFEPKSDTTFESLIRDICAKEWDDPRTDQFGRSGQKQYGVDVYGSVQSQGVLYRAAQCKLRKDHKPLTKADIEREVKDAANFPHPLDELIIATNCPRDSHTQILIDTINQRQRRKGKFLVSIWFWDNITARLAVYRSLLVKYYRDHLNSLTTAPIVEDLIDQPLFVAWSSYHATAGSRALELQNALRARGIRVGDLRSNSPLDGFLYWYESDTSNAQDLAFFVASLYERARYLEVGCPLFVVVPSRLLSDFQVLYKRTVGSETRVVHVLTDDQSTPYQADHIVTAVFPFGYARRGAIPTIDLTFRTMPTSPQIAMLDVDWQPWLSTSTFPSPDIWHETIEPAMEAIRKAVLASGNTARVQIRSLLPLPAALAVGYAFNVRLARVGVWARSLGGSGFQKHFWWSDASPATVTYPLHWVKPIASTPQHAVVELTTHLSMTDAIEAYLKQTSLPCDAWAQLHLDPSADIEESVAVAYANQAGRLLREMAAKGVTDFHLFLRMPSPLAVLVGQRLQACGRLHLYWFTNPAYQYAFTLF
jgi:hypothetical protein